MAVQKYVRHLNRSRSIILVVAIVFFIMSLLSWKFKQPCPSVESPVFNHMGSVRALTKLESKIRINLKSDYQNVTDCPIVDLFSSIDPTARFAYDKNLVCDDEAKKSDILCRMYLRQLGLGHLERSTCRLENTVQVPKIAYFVIFGNYVSQFWHYVAVKAAKKFLNASAIYVIGDQHPSGHWWEMVLKEVPDIRFLYREKPLYVSGKAVQYPHHFSDVVRLQVLLMNGGIYLDADMVVVRDLDPLLDYDITLGLLDKASGMGNAFIVAKRRNPFLFDWYANYTDFLPAKIYWNSLQAGRNLWYKNTSRVHMESDRIYRPNWFEPHLLFKQPNYPWRKNYAVHVWTNGNAVPKSPADIETANTTIAKIFRYVLYGDDKAKIKPGV